MSVTLLRHAKLDAIGIKKLTGVDGQGKPTYGALQTINGRVVRIDDVVRSPAGADVATNVRAWFDAAQSPLPADGDQLTLADGLLAIVVTTTQVKGIQSGLLDHVLVAAREV